MKLSVPFIPDKDYIHFLKTRIQSIESVYFPLQSGPVLDARIRLEKTGLKKLSAGLKQIGTVKKYCLLNSRFIHPRLYHDKNFISRLMDSLEYLRVDSDISGLVFSDAYLLFALSAGKNRIIHELEAVPGINCMIDSFEKALSFFEFIETTGFLLPKKIILDRSLNRDLSLLEKTGSRIKEHFLNIKQNQAEKEPIKIELLANEGCIHHCPYKLSHDSQISFSNVCHEKGMSLIYNQTTGCRHYFFSRPERFFKSPFIRPEDVNQYRFLADTIKLCGRTLGSRFLTRVIKAYARQAYDGNLLELMDAVNWLSDHYHIDNKALDPGFFKMITQCTKDCKTCKLCNNLFLNAVTKKSLTIRDYKDYQ